MVRTGTGAASTRRRSSLAVAGLFLAGLPLLTAGVAAGAEPAQLPAIDWRVDGPVLGAAVVAQGSMLLFTDSLAPKRCHWCEPPAADQAVRRSLRWDNTDAAATTSDVFLIGVPLLAYGAHSAIQLEAGERAAWTTDTVIISETLLLTTVLTTATKYAVGRARPYAWAAGIGSTPEKADDVESFFSGHTSSTMSVVTSVAMLATLRGEPTAPWFWALGVPLSLSTGYFRIAADKHWATDVLTGAAVGATMGVVVPWLHLKQTTTTGAGTAAFAGGQWMAQPVPGGAQLSWGGVW